MVPSCLRSGSGPARLAVCPSCRDDAGPFLAAARQGNYTNDLWVYLELRRICVVGRSTIQSKRIEQSLCLSRGRLSSTDYSKPLGPDEIPVEVTMRNKILVAALICLTLNKAQALDSTRAITQYAHTVWRNRDGYFASAPFAIAQTKDGYIWIGTATGLLRFDGVRFAPWDPPKEGPRLPSTITVLFASRDGSLWIGTGRGLARWYDGKLTDYSDSGGRVNSIVEDQQRHVWIARSRVQEGSGPLCEVAGSNLRCYGRADGISERSLTSLTIDSSGSFWLGGEGALIRWTRRSAQVFNSLDSHRNYYTQISALAASRDGDLWVGFSGTGHGLGLERFTGETWQTVTIGHVQGESFQTSSLFIDSTNSLWVGTDSKGIYRIHGGALEHFDTSDGLSGDDVQAFFEDTEHNLWVATATGVDCFRDLPVISYGKREGLTADQTNSVYAAGDGTVWVGLVGGLDSIRYGVVSPIRAGKKLPGAEVTAMLVDHTGRLWLGVDDGLYLYQHGRFDPILDKKGKRSGVVTQLAEDADSSIWATAPRVFRRLLHIRGDVITEEFSEGAVGVTSDPRGGVWLNLQNAIAHRQNGVEKSLKIPPGIHTYDTSDIVADHQGALWASIAQGILRFDGDNWQLLGANNGLPCPSRGSLIFDSQGSLWLTQSCGIVRIDRNALQNWIQHPEAKVSTLVLDRFDGVQLGGTSFRPSASLGSDGRLWFVTEYEVEMLDPADLHTNTYSPPVHIERLIADHEDVAITRATRVRPLTRDIEIDYTALSFVMPQRVRFRYKLEGHDNEWQDGGTRRSAFYMNLRPGTYKFLVTASNNSGIWNDEGASLAFTIAPAWYQTGAFRISCLLAGLFLLWVTYYLRMKQTSRSIRARFDERIAERTRLSRDLHDTLLQTLQGSKLVADDALENRSDAEHMRRSLEKLSEWIDRAMREGRAALNALHSSASDNRELSKRLQSALDERELKGVREGALTVSGTPVEMDPIITDEICRVGYEAIRNAFVHSYATRIEVQLTYSEDFTLIVRDNGCGMDSTMASRGRDGHYGLQSMRERAVRIRGKLQLITAPNLGTTIELKIEGKTAFGREAGVWSKLVSRLGGTRGSES